jgi:hypothetical protein
MAQLYPQAQDAHFSRLLRHAWATLGLFFTPDHHTVGTFVLKGDKIDTVKTVWECGGKAPCILNVTIRYNSVVIFIVAERDPRIPHGYRTPVVHPVTSDFTNWAVTAHITSNIKRNQVSHSHEATDTFVVLCVLIFTFLYTRREVSGSKHPPPPI